MFLLVYVIGLIIGLIAYSIKHLQTSYCCRACDAYLKEWFQLDMSVTAPVNVQKSILTWLHLFITHQNSLRIGSMRN